jgi:tetratricopeptide (TPR) repeat protein/SAM-dependent methyltransferase
MTGEMIEVRLDDALRLCRAGDFKRAEQVYRELIADDPGTPDAWNNLALIYYQQNRLAEAADAVKRATQLRPNIPQYWLMRGNIEMAQHRGNDAQESFSRAIELAPQFAEAHYRRALGYHREYKLPAAIAAYRQALRIAPDVAEIHFQLAEALALHARYEEAMGAYEQAFLRDVDGEFDRRGCFECMRNLQFESLPEFWQLEITRFFARGDIDKTRYVGVGLQALAVKPAFRAIARQSDTAFAADAFALSDITCDKLFMLLLRDALIVHPELEAFLTRLRARVLLDEALRTQLPLDFLCALAMQCSNNEYIYVETAVESARVESLQRETTDALQPLIDTPDSFWRAVVVLLMYRPLQSAGDLQQRVTQASVPAATTPLFERTITDLKTERDLRQHVRVVGDISDGVSRAVRGMYEEHPYPRWFALDRWPPLPYAEWLAREVPMWAGGGECAAAPRILVAGCGTGQDAIWLATDIVDARVLAIDLSLSSLAYAQRMADALHVENIEFRQCDILGVGALDEKFDLVYSKGVLHHMREPAAGLSALRAVMRAGGLFKVGLYSESARESVNAARAIVRERKIEPTTTAIRELRQYIFELPPDSPLLPLIACNDFYSTSMCRDLMFHVQEHQFRLPQVVAMLREQGLTVLGLSDLPRNAVSAYCEMFPQASVADNFENWDHFERRHPATFMSMYQLWSRSPDI